MSDDNKRKNIADEIAEARERLRFARLLADAGSGKDAVSRAYYAAFHAARAMLLTLALEPRSHRGLREMFRARFADAGLVPPDLAVNLDRLEAARLGADYGVGRDFAEDEARDLLARAEAVVDGVAAALRAGGWIA